MLVRMSDRRLCVRAVEALAFTVRGTRTEMLIAFKKARGAQESVLRMALDRLRRDRAWSAHRLRDSLDMTNSLELKRFESAHALASGLAGDIAARLARAIAARGEAGLLVSGGHSPATLFEQLRTQVLEWSRVSIGLVDERWVEPTDPASNERFVREALLRDRAAAAHFFGLKNPAPSPDLGAAAAWSASAHISRPADITVLGMGDDGHMASLFPGSPNLKCALDLEASEGCIGMWSPSVPQARLSLNLRALLDSRHVFIFIQGEAKLRTYAAACGPGPVEEMPVRAVLRQQRVPVEVVWAP
jgi:6-phosphogluconolactonase